MNAWLISEHDPLCNFRLFISSKFVQMVILVAFNYCECHGRVSKILQAGYTSDSTVVYVYIYIQKQNDNIFYIALKKLAIKLIFRPLLKAAKNKLSAGKLSDAIVLAKSKQSHEFKIV